MTSSLGPSECGRQPACMRVSATSFFSGLFSLQCVHAWTNSMNQASIPGNKSIRRTRRMDIKVGRQAIGEATEKLRNWGRWGKGDQIGTLNHVAPEDIVKAASLIRTGKV